MKDHLLKDRDWASIDGELCLVVEFAPLATVRSGQVTAINTTTPYASVTLGTEGGRKLDGFISHPLDFQMLWAAFNQRIMVTGTRIDVRADLKWEDLCLDGLSENEEVWLMWTRKKYKSGAGFFRMFLPKLIVMVSPKGGLELLRNESLRPELSGLARARASTPLITWTPDVMDM